LICSGPNEFNEFTEEFKRGLSAAGFKAEGKQVRTVYQKPVPGDVDEWTHWLHGPDGNAVARDKRSGPPENVQWIGRPRWPKSHDVGISMTGMVTAGGRLFYIADDGPVGILAPDRGLEQWKIFARDAFSGVLLWTKPTSIPA
jgi:hypothetical protein